MYWPRSLPPLQALLVVAAMSFAAPLSVNADAPPDWESGEAPEEEAQTTAPDESAQANSEAVAEGASEEPAPLASPEDAPSVQLSLDARLAALDTHLAEIEAPTKRHFLTWVGVQSALVVGQLGMALGYNNKAYKGSYFIGAGVSAASLGLFLISPRPGIKASRRYREMSTRSDSEKQAKLAAGEEDLTRQAEADLRSTSWSRHLLGVGVALGSGAAVALIYDHSLKVAAQRVFLTFFVSELQILSRPRTAIRNFERHFGRKPGTEVAFAPMLDRYTQGVSLNARF